MEADFGIIGMGVMGKSLALNIERRGFVVSVFNRTSSKTEEFVSTNAKGKNIIPYYNIKEFTSSLKKPHKIMLMVKAGKPIDDFIKALLPYLEEGDLIIDGGNTYFKDTDRREKFLAQKNILYLGAGISGGEYGALYGPSIMAGGEKEGYEMVKKIFEKISAKINGKSCSAYLGEGGAGHFVKMVHNGIEYSLMESLSEAYFIMKEGIGLSYEEMGEVVGKWNKGKLNSYLVEITGDILRRKDEETGKPILEIILDKAKQKGTGKWVAQTSLDMGVPISSISQSVEARIISSWKKLRESIYSLWNIKREKIDKENLHYLENAVYASFLLSFIQGLHLIKEANEELGYDIPLNSVLQVWKGGCIIRASLLYLLENALNNFPNLLLSPSIKKELEMLFPSLKKIVYEGIKANLPLPVLSSSLNYFLSFTSQRLPANLVQAQRDYFGSHTYQRIDREGSFHTKWQE